MKGFRDTTRSVEQMTGHLDTWTRELSVWRTRRVLRLTDWRVVTADGVEHALKLGQGWPSREGVVRFSHAPVVVPDDWVLADTELRLDFGGEALVRLTDGAGQRLAGFGSNPPHREWKPLPPRFAIEAEAVAHELFGVPVYGPSLAQAELAEVDPTVQALKRWLEVIAATARAVADAELARALCEVAEIAIARLRLPTATADVGPRLADLWASRSLWRPSFEPTDHWVGLDAGALASVAAAIAALDDGLALLRRRYPKQGRILAAGHAHIDYAWLWPQPETERKILRTFHSVSTLIASHPELVFVQSSAQYYRHVEELDPALFAAIRAHVAAGRWQPIGGMVIETDTNMPSAEAFSRQLLYGQRYFQDRFGVTSKVGWLPDTFGFTAALPQILRAAGIETLVTIKITWNETNRLPDTIFRWRGNDGSAVLVHTFDAIGHDGYNMRIEPAALVEVWSKHTSKDLADTTIASYGYGDGGGGPSAEQIETMPLLNAMPALPVIEHGSIAEHLDRLARDLDGAAVPVWSGELYLEYHRATLTTQGRMKQLNRLAERALVAAEALSVLAKPFGVAMPALVDDWWLLLRNQFHDILPGSSIRDVYRQTEAELDGVVGRAEAAAAVALAAIAGGPVTVGVGSGAAAEGGLAIANISGSAKPRWQIESAEPLPAGFDAQKTRDGWVATGTAPLAPLSVSAVRRPAKPGPLGVGRDRLDNDFVAIRLDEHGRIGSFFDKRSGREFADGPLNRLLAYGNDLPRNYDAWDIEPGFQLNEREITEVSDWRVGETGPHLGEISIARPIGNSVIRQRLRLWANSPRLDVVTEIDWHDRHIYLRAAFPVAVAATQAVYDQAIGVIERPTHDNTSWQRAQFEACGHRFVALSEPGGGVSLASDAKYGFSVKANVITISLIRGPTYPDMLADEGRHRFTYALIPHDGRWWRDDVLAEVDLVADPLRVAPCGAAEGVLAAPVRWSGPSQRLHALKPAEAGGGAVLRLSEAAGARGRMALIRADGGGVQPVDGLERPIAGDEAPLLTPFQLSSWLLADATS